MGHVVQVQYEVGAEGGNAAWKQQDGVSEGLERRKGSVRSGFAVGRVGMSSCETSEEEKGGKGLAPLLKRLFAFLRFPKLLSYSSLHPKKCMHTFAPTPTTEMPPPSLPTPFHWILPAPRLLTIARKDSNCLRRTAIPLN